MPLTIGALNQTSPEEVESKINDIKNSSLTRSNTVKITHDQKIKIDVAFKNTLDNVGKNTEARESRLEAYEGTKKKTMTMIGKILETIGLVLLGAAAFTFFTGLNPVVAAGFFVGAAAFALVGGEFEFHDPNGEAAKMRKLEEDFQNGLA